MTAKPLTARQADKTMDAAFKYFEQAFVRMRRIAKERYPDDADLEARLFLMHGQARKLKLRVERDAEAER